MKATGSFGFSKNETNNIENYVESYLSVIFLKALRGDRRTEKDCILHQCGSEMTV